MARVPSESNLTATAGVELLQNRFYNKSTAFTLEERKSLGIGARLPTAVETLEEQLARCVRQLDHFSDPLHKYAFLRALQETNNTLYFALILKHLVKTLPIIYTPTVGAACQSFSHLYSIEHGIFVKQTDRGNVRQVLDAVGRRELDVIVVTDGSRILGLGDLGANGMGIPIGKCSLYVAGAGLDPRRVCPITLDVGTNSDYYLKHPLYLGLRQRRCNDGDFYGLLDEFMEAVYERFPEVMVQFEDFSNNHCFDMLERYRRNYRCFNDDIQGTGAVIAAGVANALRLADVHPRDQRILVYGAGSAAVGVVEAIGAVLAAKYKMTNADFVNRVYLVDTRGLVTASRPGRLAKHKVPFARNDVAPEDNGKYRTLEDTVRRVKPTILIGLAGAGRAFTEDIIRSVSANCARPIILPLSNPTSKAEISAENAFKWTGGRAIVASGSPFAPVKLDGKVHITSQGNNMYVFPGIGLGAAVSRAKTLSDGIMTTAAIALADMVPEKDLEHGLYPPLEDIRNVSVLIAAAVVEESVKEGVAMATDLPKDRAGLIAHIRRQMWEPRYPSSETYAALAKL
jgi:malate dehydrogenase (oxaloacetate-decarboxylating)